MCTFNIEAWRRFRFGQYEAVLERIEKAALGLILKGPRTSDSEDENARKLGELEQSDEFAVIMCELPNLPDELHPGCVQPMKVILWALQLGGEIVEATRRTG